MYNVFLAVALTIIPQDFKVLGMKDLKNDITTQTIKTEKEIPDITDQSFMAESETFDMANIIMTTDISSSLSDELINLDINEGRNFADIEDEKFLESIDTKELDEAILTPTFDEVLNQSQQVEKQTEIDMSLDIEPTQIGEIEESFEIVDNFLPDFLETKKEELIKQPMPIEPADLVKEKKLEEKTVETKIKKPVEMPSIKAILVDTPKAIETAKKIEEPKVDPARVKKEAKKEAEKEVQTPTKVETDKEFKLPKIAQIAQTKQEYEKSDGIKAYLTQEEILDLKLGQKQQINAPTIRPRSKERRDFATNDVPPELLSDKRSLDNRHIPIVMNNKEIQNMAKIAIQEDNLDRIRAIVENARNPDLALDDYKTILNYAAMLKRHRIMMYLIYNGADINLNTPIFSSIENGDIQGLSVLLERNANVNVKNDLHQTPLMLAMQKRNEKIALLLFKYGADGNEVDYNNENCLQLARRYKMIKVEAVLLNKNL
jgi:hypothetical protein